jgi:hypothetical protein
MKDKRHPTLRRSTPRRSGHHNRLQSYQRRSTGGSATPELVHSAIEELGFVHNVAARMLNGEPSKKIGFIVPSIADPCFANCAEAIQIVARRFHCLVVVTVIYNDREIEREISRPSFGGQTGCSLRHLTLMIHHRFPGSPPLQPQWYSLIAHCMIKECHPFSQTTFKPQEPLRNIF